MRDTSSREDLPDSHRCCEADSLEVSTVDIVVTKGIKSPPRGRGKECVREWR